MLLKFWDILLAIHNFPVLESSSPTSHKIKKLQQLPNLYKLNS